jgi:hypothetical protein
VLRAKERAPTPFPSVVFIFRLAIESIKELVSASHGIKRIMEIPTKNKRRSKVYNTRINKPIYTTRGPFMKVRNAII